MEKALSEELKHTPGPWKMEAAHGCSHYIHAPSQRAMYFLGSSSSWGRAEQEANAHLIAAAPDLLAALRRSVVALEECANHLDSYRISQLEETRLIIAKAEGRAA